LHALFLRELELYEFQARNSAALSPAPCALTAGAERAAVAHRHGEQRQRARAGELRPAAVSARGVHGAGMRAACLEVAQAGAHAAALQALSDIEALKAELEGARVDRKHKEEYEVRVCRLAALWLQRNVLCARSPVAAKAVSGLSQPCGHASRHRQCRARHSRVRAGERSDRCDG